MDEEIRRYLDEMRRDLNDGFQRVLDRLGSLHDTLVRWDREARIAALEARKAP
jgi:hypothetical protein